MRVFFSRLWPFVRRSLNWVLVGSAGGLLMNILASAVPVALGRAIDAVLAVEETSADPLALRHLLHSLLIFAAAATLYSLCRVAKRMGFRFSENRLRRHLREAGFANLLRWPMARLRTMRVGDIMSRMVGDVDVMSGAVRRVLTESFDSVVMMAVAFAVLVYYDARLTLVVALPLPFVVVLAEVAGRAVQRRTLAARTAAGAVAAHLEEAISGIRVLRLLGSEEERAHRLDGLTRNEMDRNLSVVRLQSGILPACSALARLGSGAVILLGGAAVCRGEMSVGDLTAYLILFERAVRRSLVIASVLNGVHAGRAALTRTQALLSGPGQAAPAVPPRPVAGQLRIRGLTFSYPGAAKAALSDLDLTVRAGELVGITGPVGAGKSALARSLLGLYPWSKGRLELGDGRPADLEHLRAAVAYCPQDAGLFSGTIAANITLRDGADDADPERLQRAVYVAALEEDLADLPEGLATPVGQGGVRVSGGQRQRIALARSFYSGRMYLVLDDPFAAVDLAIEQEIIGRLRQHLGQRAVVLFSHRLAAFAAADQVLVLDAGRVVERGTHRDLRRTGSLYSAICRAQILVERGAA